MPYATVYIGVMAFGPPALVGVGALGFSVSVAYRPVIAVPLIVLTLPFYLHPRTVGGFEVSLTEALILLSIFGIVLGIALRVMMRVVLRAQLERTSYLFPELLMRWIRGPSRSLRLPPPSPLDWAVAAFLLAALLSLVVSEYPRQSLRELRWLIVEPLVVLYLARATITTPDRVRVVLWSVVAAGVVAAVVSLATLAVSGEILSPLARATQPYLSPNHLGLFLGRAGAVALAIALFASAPRAGPIERRAAWLAAGVIAGGLLRTVSLGAWAGLAAAAVAVGALRGRRWLLGTALAAALVVLVAIVALPAARTTGRLDPTTGTALFRLQIWSASLHMIGDHPLLGVGLDNFLYRYRAGYMLPEAAEEPNISHPHNWVLNFWLELGLLGLAAAVGCVAWTLARAWRLVSAPRSPSDPVVGIATIGVFADTLVHGLIDNSYFLVDAAVLWWLFVALVVVSTQTPPPLNRPGGPVP